MRRPAPTGSTTAAMLLALALISGACSGGGDDDRPDPEPDGVSTSRTGTTPALETTATLGRITGRLAKRERQHLKRAVRDVVDEWFDAAYLSGGYPRHDFRDAFPGFTSGARADARHDRRLMSNADLGRRIEGVRATKRRVRIDVLAVRRRPVGVTARFLLQFATQGRLEREVDVRGRLFLTRGEDGWRVFGYDVTKGAVR